MSRPTVVIVCILAPPNRGGLNSTHIHGTSVPVEEPSTASKAELMHRSKRRAWVSLFDHLVGACEQHGRHFGGQAAQRSSRCHERLDHSIAAINHDDRAGYIGREVGGKEDRWPNNILRLSGSTERCVIDKDLH